MSSVNPTTCTNCILSVNDTKFITFDSQGVCNYCNYYYTSIKKLGSSEDRKAWITNKIIEIKKKNKNRNFDCILGVSGGVDSTYLAYWCKENNLRPLIVHFDNGWNSELASKNIENICNILNFKLNTFVINWQEFKELQTAYIKAGVIDIEVLTDHAIYATLLMIAKKHHIKYILSGFNLSTEAIMPKDWVYNKLDWSNIKDIYGKFGNGTALKTYPHVTFYQKLYNYWFLKTESIQVLNYINYIKKDAKQVIARELNWVDYGGKHYESVFTKFYQSYMLPVKFKVDKRKAHLATLICSGQISKEEAIKELESPPFDTALIEDEKAYVLKKLGIPTADFDRIMKETPRLHTDFKTENELWEKYFKLISFFKFRRKKGE